jgi:hypothetical protein
VQDFYSDPSKDSILVKVTTK